MRKLSDVIMLVPLIKALVDQGTGHADKHPGIGLP